MLELLQQESEFRLGDPWRLTDRSVTVVVPIIRVEDSGRRGYVLIEEVKDKVRISDTGDINRVKVKGIDEAFLMRSGVVIQGIKTQSRSVESSRVILPGSEVEVKVRCVHASHPIKMGAEMKFSDVGVAPLEVQSVLLSSSAGSVGQYAVWESVRSCRDRASSVIHQGVPTSSVAEDDLINSMREVREFREDLEDAISKMPIDVKGQVGMVVLDTSGVKGLEMFDHPMSWKAASETVARNYSEVLVSEGESSLFELNRDAVGTSVKRFLDQIKNVKEKVVDDSGRARTIVFENENLVGERTFLDDKEIHLVITKKKKETCASSKDD